MQMQQAWTLHVLYASQGPYQFYHIMSILGAEITYIHTLEDVLLVVQQRFQRVVETYNLLAALVVKQTP